MKSPDPQPLRFPVHLQSPAGLSVQVNANGSIRRLDHGDIMINLFLGTEMEGGPANLYLRRRGPVIEATPLLGPRSPAAFRIDRNGLQAVGTWNRIRFEVSFVLAASAPAWFWHVSLENLGDSAAELDLLYAQDLALAHYGAVRLNEFYTSHYVDHTPLRHPERGVVLASRQNLSMGGRHPWTAIGALGRGVGYATDALQLHGLQTRAGRPAPGLFEGLPSTRLQHEHSLVTLQDEVVRPAPGETARRGFFGWFEADHPPATSEEDLAFVERAIRLPEAVSAMGLEIVERGSEAGAGSGFPDAYRPKRTATPTPCSLGWSGGLQTPDSPDLAGSAGSAGSAEHGWTPAAATLFSAAPLLQSQDLDRVEIDALFGPDRREEETSEGRLLSFFTGADRHVVLKAKELRVLRPHAHILRTGRGLTPDESSLTSTAWMAGVFHSMVTQGHVSINRFLSTVHGYLGLLRGNGQRLFVESAGARHLLDVPSAFEMAPQACRWVYKHRDGMLVVRSAAEIECHRLTLSVEVLRGSPVRLLLVHHLAINGDDGSEALLPRVCRDAEGVFVGPLPDTDVGRRFPWGGFHLAPLRGTVLDRLGGDEMLFADGSSRSQPFLCLETAPTLFAGFRLTGRLIQETAAAEAVPEAVPDLRTAAEDPLSPNPDDKPTEGSASAPATATGGSVGKSGAPTSCPCSALRPARVTQALVDNVAVESAPDLGTVTGAAAPSTPRDSTGRCGPGPTCTGPLLESGTLNFGGSFPRRDDPDSPDPSEAERFWTDLTGRLRLRPPQGSPLAGATARLGEILPWFVHNALIHYLAPRGIEQYTGGGWGTRDTCQGPVEMLLALARVEPIRDLLRRVFRNQNPDGDWPQWFMFFERERHIRPDDAHGDIVFWPLLALARYLQATGEAALLEETVPFFHPEGEARAEQASLWQHVERALALIAARGIPGTRLAAYGHGDWNDSMQPYDPAMRERLCSSWTVTLHFQTLTALAAALARLGRTGPAAALAAVATAVRDEFQQRLLPDGIVAGLAYFREEGRMETLLHPRDRTTGVSYSLLPMVHAVINDLFTPEQAERHLELIRRHLTGQDGARLFDRPLAYRGGPQRYFQRAETAAYFGREIGLMYTHAHLRYAEALARYGDAEGFFLALAQANPVGLRSLVPAAALRQANCYYSSSDAAFADRYQAGAAYERVRTGDIALEGGWRVYSSGAGIWTRLFFEGFLGLCRRWDVLILDPVLPPALDGLRVDIELEGLPLEIAYRIGSAGSGPLAVNLNGSDLPFTRGANAYRVGAAEIPMPAVRERLDGRTNLLTVNLG